MATETENPVVSEQPTAAPPPGARPPPGAPPKKTQMMTREQILARQQQPAAAAADGETKSRYDGPPPKGQWRDGEFEVVAIDNVTDFCNTCTVCVVGCPCTLCFLYGQLCQRVIQMQKGCGCCVCPSRSSST